MTEQNLVFDKDVLEKNHIAATQNITPRDRLKFAKTILLVLSIMFTLGGMSELIHPQNNVFEACRTILPSFATLVIGYYFAKM
jgi:hypothetical protein